MSVRVQFVLNDEEYETLKAHAERKGVSISKYVKDCVLLRSGDSDNLFEQVWEEFSSKLSTFPPNVEFNVSTIMTKERWETFDRSTKMSLARLFNRKVTSDPPEYDNIKVIGRSPANVSLYIKTHA